MGYVDGYVVAVPTAKRAEYEAVARDAAALEKWDNNGGQDYAARVSSSSPLPAPAFWGLDPYRYDNEKVRVNGQAGYGGRAAPSARC